LEIHLGKNHGVLVKGSEDLNGRMARKNQTMILGRDEWKDSGKGVPR